MPSLFLLSTTYYGNRYITDTYQYYPFSLYYLSLPKRYLLIPTDTVFLTYTNRYG